MRLHPKGFSLVELLVAVGIASVLMVGLSVFFTTSLKQAFTAREETSASQEQFTANALFQKKLGGIGSTLNLGAAPAVADHLVALNQPDEPMPFTYLGKRTLNGEEKLVIKDFLPFNKIILFEAQPGIWMNVYGNSGAGTLVNPDPAAARPVILRNLPKNFGGFSVTPDGKAFAIVIPQENKIVSCAVTPVNCSPREIRLVNESLKSPMDIVTNNASGSDLRFYVSDAGNNRVLEFDAQGSVTRRFEFDFNFPTGLAYYRLNASTQFLFVADTFHHQVKRVKLQGAREIPDVTVVAGAGDDEDCAQSARACKLLLPTGLFVGGIPGRPATELALYVADSGHHRILRVRDPGRPVSVTLNFSTPAGGTGVAIKRLVVRFPPGVNAGSATMTISSSGNLNTSGLFSASANEIEYQLFTALAEDSPVTNSCDSPPCPQERIRPSVNFFRSSDQIQMTGEPAPFNISLDGNELQLDPSMTVPHAGGEEVLLATPVTAFTPIQIEINGLVTTAVTDPYSLIMVEARGLSDQLLWSVPQGLRVGNGALGTFEDIVEVLPPPFGGPLQFPTGVNNAFVASSGGNPAQVANDSSSQNFTPYDVTAFSVFESVSEFELEAAADALQFEKSADQILKMIFKRRAGEETVTHTLQTHLSP